MSRWCCGEGGAIASGGKGSGVEEIKKGCGECRGGANPLVTGLEKEGGKGGCMEKGSGACFPALGKALESARGCPEEKPKP